MTWTVVLYPEGNNVDTNEGGMIVYLQSSSGTKEEVSRVAFVRRNGKNKKTGYKAQLKKEIKKAQESAKALNADNGVLK